MKSLSLHHLQSMLEDCSVEDLELLEGEVCSEEDMWLPQLCLLLLLEFLIFHLELQCHSEVWKESKKRRNTGLITFEICFNCLDNDMYEIHGSVIRLEWGDLSWGFFLWGQCICWWSLEERALNLWSQRQRYRWPACELYSKFPLSLQTTTLLFSNLGKKGSTGMVENIFVLLYEFVGSQIAVLIKEVNFENLFAIRWVCIGKNVGDEEGKDVSECSVADISREDVVVVGVEELY